MKRKTPEAERTPSSRKPNPNAAGKTGPEPGQDNDPQRGGYHHADTAMGTSHSDMIADFEQTITDRDDESPDARRRKAGERERKK